jgi:hypothetical protein
MKVHGARRCAPRPPALIVAGLAYRIRPPDSGIPPNQRKHRLGRRAVDFLGLDAARFWLGNGLVEEASTLPQRLTGRS